MEEKTFEIQGHNLVIRELLIEQFETLTKLVEDIEIEKTSQLSGVLGSLITKKLDKLMALIFFEQPEVKEINWKRVTYELMDEIIECFLALNPRLKKRLKTLLTILASSALINLPEAETK
jgi:hypothetical protein